MPRRSARRRAGSRRQRRCELRLGKPIFPSWHGIKHTGAWLLRTSGSLPPGNCPHSAPRSAIELVGNRHNLTSRQRMAVATSDGIVLDYCQLWTNLARLIIADRHPQTRLLDLASRED